MSIEAKMVNLDDLFSQNVFTVPSYQRTYAWNEKQWEDLWSDIYEGMLNNNQHYLGTVVLKETGKSITDSDFHKIKKFEIVDGQQRITSISLIVLAICSSLKGTKGFDALWKDYLCHEGNYRITLSTTNKDYWISLLENTANNTKIPDTLRTSNKLLLQGYKFYKDKIKYLTNGSEIDIKELVVYIRNSVLVLKFVTQDQVLAVKTFQSVNDRGRPLSLLEKTKSFLMFYATRYCSDDISFIDKLDTLFTNIFEQYDQIRDISYQEKIDYVINQKYRFTEDELLRFSYYYASKNMISKYKITSIGYNYNISALEVFEEFVKETCIFLKNKPKELKSYIINLVETVNTISIALHKLLLTVKTDSLNQKVIKWQGMSASVYPLAIAAVAQDTLTPELLEDIRILDMRVYKVRGTDPRADLYKNAISELIKGKAVYYNVRESIRDFLLWFGSDAAIDQLLRSNVYRSVFTKYVLWTYLNKDEEEPSSDFNYYDSLQVEHILSQEPSFDISSYGFSNPEDYNSQIHTFGNLTLLEKDLNLDAKNMQPTHKARKIYPNSNLEKNRLLAESIKKSGFSKKTIQARTNQIVEHFKMNWKIQ